jgi:hypothetical protein
MILLKFSSRTAVGTAMTVAEEDVLPRLTIECPSAPSLLRVHALAHGAIAVRIAFSPPTGKRRDVYAQPSRPFTPIRSQAFTVGSGVRALVGTARVNIRVAFRFFRRIDFRAMGLAPLRALSFIAFWIVNAPLPYAGDCRGFGFWSQWHWQLYQ